MLKHKAHASVIYSTGTDYPVTCSSCDTATCHTPAWKNSHHRSHTHSSNQRTALLNHIKAFSLYFPLLWANCVFLHSYLFFGNKPSCLYTGEPLRNTQTHTYTYTHTHTHTHTHTGQLTGDSDKAALSGRRLLHSIGAVDKGGRPDS